MNTPCGKPAVHFGTLQLAHHESASESFGYNRPVPAVQVAFCLGCTRTPRNKWHRQFVADRPARAGEKCGVIEPEVDRGE